VPAAPAAELTRALELMNEARRPILYGGGGIGLGNAVGSFRKLVEATRIPTVLTLKGLGALPSGHPLLLGMLGMHGARSANLAVQECDLLICIGARFDDRATGKLAEFAPKAKVIHLDVDPAEVSKLRRAEVALLGELNTSLTALSAARPPCGDWRAQCAQRKATYATRYDAPGKAVYAPALLRQLSRMCADDTIVCCDVGQHQMWVAQHCLFNHPTRHLSSGGLGTMGFGLPAAIGAQFAEPGTEVVVVSGDGSFMMNVQELATIARYQLPIKIVLLDNQALGMVRQWQELFFSRRYSEVDLSDNPDFAALSAAFGIPAFRLNSRDKVEHALQALLAMPGPALLHVAIDTHANVWPLVPPNSSNASMMEPEREAEAEVQGALSA
jgi:acetolactate synthase-1/2/3 large subunit